MNDNIPDNFRWHAKRHLEKTVFQNSYVPITPFKKQSKFLISPQRETLYGGGAGSGKSLALLAAAGQYVKYDHFSALLLRTSMPKLKQQGGLIDVSKQWWNDTAAEYHVKDRRWRFPSGAVVQFGYLENPDDIYQYQGSSYHLIGFDELTEFDKDDYLFLFRSLRKSKDDPIPLRMMSTTNPVGSGFRWVKKRFPIEEGVEDDKRYIHSTFDDNPHIDNEQYRKSLSRLDEVMRRKLEEGSWKDLDKSNIFKRENLEFFEDPPAPEQIESIVRYWDFAATEPSLSNPDPDYCVGVKMAYLKDRQIYVVMDVERFRADPGEVQKRIRATAKRDGPNVPIVLEVESGSQAKDAVYTYKNQILKEFTVEEEYATRGKKERARSFSGDWGNGHIGIVKGPWNEDYLEEVELGMSAFEDDKQHDDQLDASSGAHRYLVQDNIVWIV